MNQLPFYIEFVFYITVVLTVFFFWKSARYGGLTIFILIGWLALQTLLSRNGFYQDTQAVPPRFLLMIAPPVLFIILLFLLPSGRRYLDSLDAGWLTFLHIVRIPVELVLWWLFLQKMVPQLMTFEGRNFDILSGITAPFVWYFGYIKQKMSKKALLAWNFLCIALLLNIVVHAILSAPTPFQQLGFEQPNIALVYFPFVWLPCCIVPLVLLAHLASIRKLLKKQ